MKTVLEKKEIKKSIRVFLETYNKLIYFGEENNPVETKREKLSEQVQSEVGKNSGEVGKIVE